MAADFMTVNKTKQEGAEFVSLANMISEVRSRVSRLANVAGHCVNGTDYTKMEDVFGLPVGDGGSAATLLALMQNIFNTNTDVTGVNRLAQLDEIVGRVSGQ